MPYQQTRDLTSYFSAYAPLLAVLVAVGVAFMQYYLQQEQWKLQMFVKRFEVYAAVRRFLSAALNSHGSLDSAEYDRFVFETRPAKFMFGSDVASFINEIYGSISQEDAVPGTYGKYVRRLEPDHLEAEGDLTTAAMRWGFRAEVAFGPYLQIHHDQSWLARFVARVNRWVDERPDVLKARYDS